VTIPIYMDVHVPSAVTEGLRRQGHDVVTAQDDGADRLSDDALLDRATELGRLLFTQDDDLLRIAAQRQAAGRSFAGVLYAHQLAMGIGPLIGDIDLVLSVAAHAELISRVTPLAPALSELCTLQRRMLGVRPCPHPPKTPLFPPKPRGCGPLRGRLFVDTPAPVVQNQPSCPRRPFRADATHALPWCG
jgi:hypothetical protein